MKLLKKAILGLAVITLPAIAETFEDYVINAKMENQISADPNDKIWETVAEKKIILYPQLSVSLNDKNVKIDPKATKEASVKVLYNTKQIAVRISWKDDTMDLLPAKATNKYGDAVAIQFPTKFGKGITLPYQGMGDEKHPVLVYLKRAAEGKDYTKAFISEGFGSMTEITEKGFSANMVYDKDKKEWNVVIIKPIKTEDANLASGLVPVEFAIYDGNESNRDGNKYLSSWKFVKLDKFKADPQYIKYVSWGIGDNIGNPARGKELMAQNGCNGCHRYDDQNAAMEGLAPNLSNIGAIALPAYIKESIVNPNDVIIRNLNINRHYNKSAEKDKNGAYPNNDMYTWYMKDEKGKKTSKMPPFAHLSEQDLKDIVAYLKSLK